MTALSLQLKNFNDKIKLMNQLNSKELVLTAKEARDLHSEVFNLLTQIAELNRQIQSINNMMTNTSSEVTMDGGSF